MAKITEEIKNFILELCDQNYSNQEIAKKLNVSHTSVYNTLKESGKERPEKDKNLINALNESFMGRLFWEGWESDTDLTQMFFNLNQLAKRTGRELNEFLEQIEASVTQYFRHSNAPLKLFDVFLDISSNLEFFEDGYDIKDLTEILENVYDRVIYIKDLEKEYNSIEEFKKAKENEIEQERKINDEQREKWKRFGINAQKNIDNVLIKCENLLINQKAYFEKKLEKLEAPDKIKELKLENYALNQVFIEFGQRYPKEVKEFVEEIKNREIQYSEASIS